MIIAILEIMYSHSCECLSCTDTCWRSLHQAPATDHRVHDFQYNLLL